MDAMEEVAAPLCGDVHAVMKRKRTKRQRLLLPPSASTASSTSSTRFSGSTTEEEEDMANCLMLLAQGRTSPKTDEATTEGGGGMGEKYTSRRFAEAATATNGKAGFYVYECKTCNKRFSSFQALGGHRASHKKPKLGAPAMSINNDGKKAVATDDGLGLSMNSFSKPSIVLTSSTTSSISKPRVHECSICGSGFSSGQALGGHMRRHRPASTSESPEPKKERNILSLDLNLPAPSDDDHANEFAAPVFPFATKQPIVFSAPTMVDCHY